ncbi:transglutaminase domain-containing protein [Kurthia massiliensis]|uniref:transglutaminase domain-containing protein n=1 Tax=Kurthia massiliensis TaxID=1033739 RepID=UPI000288A37F|nr:transglutaminase domain-containing protein [Kurthia massiliensis]
MPIYFESLQAFQAAGGLKQTTITAQQLLPALVTHMKRGDRKFLLYINGRLPKPLSALLQDAFDISHLQEPFYTQHCGRQQSSYVSVSKNRIKIDFTMSYRMTRDEHAWVTSEIQRVLAEIIAPHMSDLQKVIAVHDYIVRNHQYEMNTTGSPFTVYTFMHEKQGVCMAYALLFAKMMDELNIPCHYVVGKADGESNLGHAWNMVQLEGHWYHIDATWNDLGSKMKSHDIRYRYFLRSDRFMERDHHWNHDHYPQCLSETYKGLSNVYDVTYDADAIYFPHPKQAHLMKMDMHTRKTTTLLPARVQCCTAFDGDIYFSHFDDERFLYKWTKNGEAVCVEQRPVASIKKTLHTFTVNFEDGAPLTFTTEQQTTQREVAAHEVQLTGFGTSWFGTYKGKAQPILFKGERVSLLIEEPHKQLAVDILCHQALQVTITSNKKTITTAEPMYLTVDKGLISSLDMLEMPYKEIENNIIFAIYTDTCILLH